MKECERCNLPGGGTQGKIVTNNRDLTLLKGCHSICFTTQKVPLEGTYMNKSKGLLKMWLPVLLLVVIVAGCAGTDTVTQNSSKAVTAYSLAGVTGTINETAKTISVTMP